MLRIWWRQGGWVRGGYADYIALVVTASIEARLMIKANDAMDNVNQMLKTQGLNLAPEKTDTVVMAG